LLWAAMIVLTGPPAMHRRNRPLRSTQARICGRRDFEFFNRIDPLPPFGHISTDGYADSLHTAGRRSSSWQVDAGAKSTTIAPYAPRAENPLMVPETRYAKTPDGGYIAYKVLGDGPKDIAVVGSIATNIEFYFEHEPAAQFWFDLASFSRLILHDRRGTGLSDDMGGLPNLETRATDLIAVLDAVGSRCPTIVAAVDGGMVAALLGATHPERVASIVWEFGTRVRRASVRLALRKNAGGDRRARPCSGEGVGLRRLRCALVWG